MTATTETVHQFLVTNALEHQRPLGEVNLTLEEIAANLGIGKRTVSYALDRLTDQGHVIERKHRKIRINLPGGSNGKAKVLTGVDFSGQDLRNVDFSNAVLHEANFEGADLRRASLREARLSYAMLTWKGPI